MKQFLSETIGETSGNSPPDRILTFQTCSNDQRRTVSLLFCQTKIQQKRNFRRVILSITVNGGNPAPSGVTDSRSQCCRFSATTVMTENTQLAETGNCRSCLPEFFNRPILAAIINEDDLASRQGRQYGCQLLTNRQDIILLIEHGHNHAQNTSAR